MAKIRSTIAAILVNLTALLLPGFAADPPYDGGVARGGPARTGDLGALKLPAKGEILWQVDIDNGAGACVVSGGAVFLAGGQSSLFGVKADGSAILWQDDRPGRVAQNSPLVVGDRIYLASSLGLSAHARADGKRLWQYPIDGGAASSQAVLVGGKVIIAGSDGCLHAVDPASGAPLWKQNAVKNPPGTPAEGGEAAGDDGEAGQLMSLSSDGSTVFVPIQDQSRVVAVDAANGKRRWSFKAKGWTQALVVVAGDAVLVTSQDGNLYCLDKANGKARWEFKTGGPITASPGVRDGSVYLGSNDGLFYRVDLKTGKQVWTYEPPKGADGNRVAIGSSPLIDADSVCFGSMDGFVYTLKLDTGALAWKVKAAEGSVVSSSTITDGRFLFVTVRPDLNKGTGTYSLVAIGELPPKKKEAGKGR